MKKRILGTFLALLMIFPFVAVLADEPAKGTERSNVDIIYDFLTGDMKLNSAAACGILANIEMESGFNPEALGDNGTSYGICQWHDIAEGSGRWTKLREFCVKNGYDPSKLMSQLYYLKYELQNFYPKVWNYVYSAENSEQGAYDVGYYWCYNFEIPDKREERSVARGNSAKEKYWPKYNATEPESAFEIWRVASEISLNVRTGPDTSYPVADKLADGTEITVTQAVSTASYVWGRIPGGWCVLDYCEYVSGAIYTVEYVTGCASISMKSLFLSATVSRDTGTPSADGLPNRARRLSIPHPITLFTGKMHLRCFTRCGRATTAFSVLPATFILTARSI